MASKSTKRRQPPKKIKPTMPADEAQGAYIGATIQQGEASMRYLTYSRRDAELVGRAIQQTIYRAAHLNALTCSGLTLRLYAPAKGGKKSLWARKRVDDRRSLAHIKGFTGRKSVEYAARAGDVDEVLDHPARVLLVDPDPFTVGSQWLYTLFWFKEVAGRSYIYAGERLPTGEPTSLYHMFPQFVRPIPSKTQYIEGFMYGRDSTDEIEVPPQDCMYLRHAVDPQNPVEAMSWVRSVVLYGDVENAALNSEIARWSNGGNPGMVLEVDEKTTDPQMSQIEARILRTVRGVSKHGLPLVLRRAKMVMAGSKPNEMQYVEGARRAEEVIYRAADIPETIWKLAESNRASATMGDPQYMSQAIRPRCNLVAEELTEYLLPQFGLEPGEMWFAFDNPVAEDRKADFDEGKVLVDMGLMLPNDYLGKLGYPLLPEEMNRYRQPAGVAPMPAPGTEPIDVEPEVIEPPDAGTLADLAERVTGQKIPQATAEAIARVSCGVNDAQVAAIFGPLAGFEKPQPPQLPPGKPAEDALEGDDGKEPPELKSYLYRSRFDAHECEDGCGHGDHGTKAATIDQAPSGIDKLAKDFADELTAWYTKSGGDALNRASTGAGVSIIPNAELDAIIERGLRSLLAYSANEGAKQLGEASFDVLPTSAIRFLDGYRVRLARDISDDFAQALNDAVKGGLERGLSYADMTAELMPVMNDASVWRAERVARTETSNAYTNGRLAAWREYEVPKKQWLLSGNPCSICEAIAAKFPDPVPLDTVFVELGETIIGADGKTYTETFMRRLGPPAHPNDACALLPVEDTTDDEP